VSKIITIQIDDEGNQTVELEGYKGKGCAAVAKVFADAIGSSKEVKRKPEYSQVTTVTKKVVQ
jgi:hypothetical protein